MTSRRKPGTSITRSPHGQGPPRRGQIARQSVRRGTVCCSTSDMGRAAPAVAQRRWPRAFARYHQHRHLLRQYRRTCHRPAHYPEQVPRGLSLKDPCQGHHAPRRPWARPSEAPTARQNCRYRRVDLREGQFTLWTSTAAIVRQWKLECDATIAGGRIIYQKVEE